MNANVVQMRQILPFGYGCGNRGIQITKICKTYFRYCTDLRRFKNAYFDHEEWCIKKFQPQKTQPLYNTSVSLFSHYLIASSAQTCVSLFLVYIDQLAMRPCNIRF